MISLQWEHRHGTVRKPGAEMYKGLERELYMNLGMQRSELGGSADGNK